MIVSYKNSSDFGGHLLHAAASTKNADANHGVNSLTLHLSLNMYFC